ncbi:MAG: hypothetical protein ABIV11_09985 [Gemmatimonadaceae bacterium]
MSASSLFTRGCIALWVATAGCGGDGPTDPTALGGWINFDYSGSETGSFRAAGRIDPFRSGPYTDGAAVLRDRYAGVETMIVLGIQMRSSLRADVLVLSFPGVTTPQTFPLADIECPSGDVPCTLTLFGSSFGTDVPVASGPPVFFFDAENDYHFTGGTVTIKSVTGTRMTGSFDGIAETQPLSGSPQVITVTNGRFDVPILSFP